MANKERGVIGAVVVLGLLVLGLGGLGIWWASADRSAGKAEPAAQSVEISMGGGKPMMLSTQPTDDQIDGMKKMLEDEMVRRMREYAAMTPEQKKKHLDEMIDQTEKLKKELGPIEPGGEPKGGPADGKPEVKVEGTPTSRRVSVRMSSKSGDKQAMENLPPDIRALMAQFKADMSARRAERGLPDTGGITIIRRETTTTPK